MGGDSESVSDREQHGWKRSLADRRGMTREKQQKRAGVGPAGVFWLAMSALLHVPASCSCSPWSG